MHRRYYSPHCSSVSAKTSFLQGRPSQVSKATWAISQQACSQAGTPHVSYIVKIQYPYRPLQSLGSLCHYVTHASPADFQPMKANFGILPPLDTTERLNKRKRAAAYAQRALADLEAFLLGLEDGT